MDLRNLAALRQAHRVVAPVVHMYSGTPLPYEMRSPGTPQGTT